MTDNLFDSFETADEIMAFVLDRAGTEGLKQLLSIFVAERRMHRESLMEAAGRLEAAGLMQGAAIAMEAIEQIADQAPFAAILADPIRANQRANFASLYRQGRVTLDDIVTGGIDTDTIEFVARSKRALAHHDEATATSMQLRLVGRITRRSGIVDVHDLCVTCHDDGHVMLVADCRDAANEALPFAISEYKALAVSWRLD